MNFNTSRKIKGCPVRKKMNEESKGERRRFKLQFVKGGGGKRRRKEASRQTFEGRGVTSMFRRLEIGEERCKRKVHY